MRPVNVPSGRCTSMLKLGFIGRSVPAPREPRRTDGRNVMRATGAERWLVQRATGVRDGNGRLTMVVNLIEDVTESKRNDIAQRLVAAAARAIATSDDLQRTLPALADAAVPGLADRAAWTTPTPSRRSSPPM
jgi:hypothetical protein